MKVRSIGIGAAVVIGVAGWLCAAWLWMGAGPHRGHTSTGAARPSPGTIRECAADETRSACVQRQFYELVCSQPTPRSQQVDAVCAEKLKLNRS